MARGKKYQSSKPQQPDDGPEPEVGADQKPKGRPRGNAKIIAGLSNVPDEVYIDFCTKALTAKNAAEKLQEEARTANSQYRDILKQAKKAGCNQGMIAQWLADRKMEITDLDRDIRDLNRIYKLMKLPVGSQLGLWNEHTTVATAIEKGQQQERMPPPPELQGGLTETIGYNAGRRGEGADKNPYPTKQAATRDAWERGRMRAQADMAEELRHRAPDTLQNPLAGEPTAA